MMSGMGSLYQFRNYFASESKKKKKKKKRAPPGLEVSEGDHNRTEGVL